MAYQDVSGLSDALMSERNTLVTRSHKGTFWKPCPGTGERYYCCGYQIVTPLTGCGMYCSYCILQEYYEKQHQVLYENYSDLVREVKERLVEESGVLRFGTGEFGDSLFLEKKLGLSQKIAELFQLYPNVLVEFKTKYASVAPLRKISDPSKVVIGFSMNTPYIISQCEKGTSSLQKRLEAAKECEAMGFWVAFHFDPMVWYKRWDHEYREVVDSIFSSIRNPERIAWVSLGGFRTMSALKNKLREYNRHLPLFSGEMVLGTDRKYRYFRPIRVDFYRTMQETIEKYHQDCTVYLCMENHDVWAEAGMLKRIPHGLTQYLDDRAETMLGLNKEIR